MCQLVSYFAIVSIFLPALLHAQDIPTLVPANPFNPSDDARRLRDAMDGLGTDEAKIVDVLCRRVGDQRDIITTTYRQEYGDDLRSDLRSELSGDFQSLSVKLTYSLWDFLAVALHDAMNGLGTKEPAVTEVLTSRTNAEIALIRTGYEKTYGVTLQSAIQSDFTGGQQQLFLNMAEGFRDETPQVNQTTVLADSAALYNDGQGQTGSVEKTFVDIFSLRSFPHLKEVSAQYARDYPPNTLEYALLTEFVGSFRDSLLDILYFAENKDDYFAKALKETTAEQGTDEVSLSRQIVSRAESDLGNIKAYYETTFGTPLAFDVAADTSGAYKDCLLAIIA